MRYCMLGNKRIGECAEYLTFITITGDSEAAIKMRYGDENIWLTQEMMAQFYSVETHTVNEHIKKVFWMTDSRKQQLFGKSE